MSVLSKAVQSDSFRKMGECSAKFCNSSKGYVIKVFPINSHKKTSHLVD